MSTTKPLVKGFFDQRTFSIQYVVADTETRKCAIIDPVLDFDEKSGAIATQNADAILSHVNEQGFEVEWILERSRHRRARPLLHAEGELPHLPAD